MYCLRCGTDTNNDHIFCDHCLDEMEQKPVKAGTPIKLPTREAAPTQKKVVRKKALPLEEQVVRLKVAARTWATMFLAAFVLMAVFAYLFFSNMIG